MCGYQSARPYYMHDQNLTIRTVAHSLWPILLNQIDDIHVQRRSRDTMNQMDIVQPVGQASAEGASVTVCRDCCCGQLRKHPEYDHDAQLEFFRAEVDSFVRVSRCLALCKESNVVVVSPSSAARRGGARPVWLGGVLEMELTRAVVDWANAGGPGVVDLPPALASLVVSPPE